MKEIKICPYCRVSGVLYGGRILLPGSPKDYWIRCKECVLSSPVRKSQEAAIEVWNQMSDILIEGMNNWYED